VSGKYKKKNAIDGQFNARTIEMMESPAYRVLSLAAHRVLDRICIELAHHGGNDNGALPVTYEQFMQYGIDRHAIAPAIRELVALGFLEVTRQGRPSAGDYRWPNLFRITWVNCRSTPIAEQTNEWRKIPDRATAERLAAQARKAGKERHARRPASPAPPHQPPTHRGAAPSTNQVPPRYR
jgi:hypothetical protein